MSYKIYVHTTCASSQKALEFLRANGVTHELRSLRDGLPAKTELRRILDGSAGGVRRLLNTSSKEYKRFNLKVKALEMTPAAIVDLVTQYPGLLRRPILLGDEVVLVGFVREVWETKLLP